MPDCEASRLVSASARLGHLTPAIGRTTGRREREDFVVHLIDTNTRTCVKASYSATFFSIQYK